MEHRMRLRTNVASRATEIKISSKYGPIYPEKKFDASFAQMRHSPSQRFNSYVLPTPQEAKSKYETYYSGPILKESNGNTKSSRWSNNGKSYPDPFSGSLLRNPVPFLSSTVKLSSRLSPNFVSLPKISELNELPMPPAHFCRPPNRIIHSGPLISKGQDFPAVKILFVMRTAASTLPVPPEVIPRSYSNPSRGQIEAALHGSKPMKTPETLKINEVIPSLPLTPISIAKVDPISPAS
ncbi:OLC1v1001800C1 [Oldenlandia corymbosa var. corymbosa]|uniref:OLC1v1001800C1 n=1 Tax=Oldenlandia corymbosa var. corymbosa TaxID=529605 RepID=A0AAV1D910_OLDCO|nr:OLC1v1001800C1 [Oldenlandia corymbosa var. corymbosa]